MADVNLIFLIVTVIVLTLLYNFCDVLRQQITTGVWDYGYLVATFVYSIIVGIVVGYSGLINLSVPFDQWLPVIGIVWAQYFLYLTILHTVMDIIIAKIWPAQPQGLATPFLSQRGKALLRVA